MPLSYRSLMPMLKPICLIAAVALFLAACGTKGPLTLPQKSESAAKASSPGAKTVNPPSPEAKP